MIPRQPQLLLRQLLSSSSSSSSSTTTTSIRPRLSSRFSTSAASDPASTIQIYLSRSRDPLLNLSVEHHLLSTTPPSSTVLMLYANTPCVVFGRNQNPWIETNLAHLASRQHSSSPVQLVRRRSGGGTVFHDEGNVNFSVICPSDVFDRNKHAAMVVRALKAMGRPNTRVNVRHDIVVDVDEHSAQNTYKVSGSAYKLTRLRSLHHGTCLLSSPNLRSISGLLRSPAEGFIKARGVDSVRSPVRNLDLDVEEFRDAVVSEFESMYGAPDVRGVIEDAPSMAVEKVMKGYAEMQSRDWLYGQTPRFTFCTHPHEHDPRPRPELPFEVRIPFLCSSFLRPIFFFFYLFIIIVVAIHHTPFDLVIDHGLVAFTNTHHRRKYTSKPSRAS